MPGREGERDPLVSGNRGVGQIIVCRRVARRHVHHVEQRRADRRDATPGKPGDRARQFPAVEERVGVGPLLHARRRSPSATAETRVAGEAAAAQRRRSGCTSARGEGAQDRDEPVLGRAELPRVLAPGLRFVDERARDGLQVAVARANARATRSTAAAGGSSLTKWAASLAATNAPSTGAGRTLGSRAPLRRRQPPRSARRAPSCSRLVQQVVKDEADRDFRGAGMP